MFKPIVGRFALAFALIAVLLYGVARCAHEAEGHELTGVSDALHGTTGSTMNVIESVPAPLKEIAPPYEGVVALPGLADYLETAAFAWKPKADAALVESLTLDLATAATVEATFGGKGREEGALVMLVLSFFEGVFLPFVDSGECNDSKWRAKAWREAKIWDPNICDKGFAWALFQLHDEGGIALTPDGEWTQKFGGLRGSTLVLNRQLAIQVAYAFVRKSFRVTRGLCGYTGDPTCRKARLREQFAANYWRAHPYPSFKTP
jgi:hypothetical protein